MRISRRKIIVQSLQSVLALGSIQYLSACSREDVEQSLESQVRDYASDMAGVSYIGETCIEMAGFDSATADAKLQTELTEKLRGRFAISGMQESFQQQFEALIRKDFADNRIVDVAGWQLSEIECQMVALAASLQGQRQAKALDMTQPTTGQFVEVLDWGPKSTILGNTFNEQSDGHSGLWLKATGASVSVTVVFAGENQVTQVYSDLLTSGIRGEYMQKVINEPGEYTVALYDKTKNIIQPVGQFQVLEPDLSEHGMSEAEFAQCKVLDWGPRHAKSEKPFNPQPTGASAFWVKTNCALEGSILILEGRELKTTVGRNLVTALVPDGHQMEPGEHELEIRLGQSDRVLNTGVFLIE